MAGPTYTYTLCTPDSASPMNQTAPLIRGNFQAMNELINVNHVGFNQENSGFHNSINMQFQTDDPGTAITDLALYTKATGSPNVAEIFYQYPNNGTVNQLTPTSSAGGGGTTAANSGSNAQGYWVQFPSGIIMFYGLATAQYVSNHPTYIPFPAGSGIPVMTQNIGFGNVTPANSTATTGNFSNLELLLQGYGTSGLYFNGSGGSGQQFYYFAIGL